MTLPAQLREALILLFVLAITFPFIFTAADYLRG